MAEGRQIRTSATLFLGAGRITSALVAGLRLARDERRIVVYDRNRGKTLRLQRQAGVIAASDLKSALEAADVLIAAVRPASMAGMLAEVAAAGSVPSLCISLAAGIPLRKLRAGLPQVRWVRAMPSPVCRIGRGLTALCFDRAVGRKDRSRAREFFLRVGQIVEVPEREFDAFTATYSSSHGYHALAALAEAARKQGLDQKTASRAAAHALADGILYWRESGLSLDELLREAATPGGIAAATMKATDRAGYARSVRIGLAAGIAQARRNAKSQLPAKPARSGAFPGSRRLP